MRMCDRGIQMLITTVGAFAAFSLMTIAVGTDYWLYSRGVCRTKSTSDNETSRKNEEVMTHSGLWRTCCLEAAPTKFQGAFRGVCKKIDHFPEDADYEQDTAEYLLRAVRASSVFPILSVTLLFFGGLCVAASEFHRSRHNVILSAGIFFVSAGIDSGGGQVLAPPSPDPETCPPSAKASTPFLPLTSRCSPSPGTPQRSPWGPSSTPTGTTLFYSSTIPHPKSSKSHCIIIRPTGAPRPSELTSDLCPTPSTALGEVYRDVSEVAWHGPRDGITFYKE
ncbi:voltage-dependent calcium channel gamma-3 subunit isoform X3 [Nomascus leucogenys]|uniref:voltage-dependent calcium channel gamma-3 subunit isoform X3 n=1 Tax=Nomascus leucogenys TaxID=61853 RepID=UPI00122D9BC8|nr:voltage-dependent calcium channel gamma-3 subunit isoform X3 [Nomascus leucogenys]XP_032013029.1 voltage-dependent calcium channel gamma-3 subunit isoform X3 [Hylobates moloch]XP_055154131.1 voltage-dependent calcium channel gamma-3 subunit isoform X3 [Symphalangus syndactylus]